MEEYIIITGGELYNKGAQAMTFVTVCEMQRRFPNAKCVLLSRRDAERSEEEKSNYKMIILPHPCGKDIVMLISGLSGKKKFNGSCFEYKHFFKNAILWIDISGYALGSNWGEKRALAYLSNVVLAKHYKIPMYLMPQSFGPFEFKKRLSCMMNMMIKHYLPYCKCIMARESDGYNLLQNKYKLNNVIKTLDLVLMSHDLDLLNVYVQPPTMMPIEIEKNSVAIIPNMKNVKYGNGEQLLDIYKRIIDYLLKKDKKVYFIYHAVEDLLFAEKVKSIYYTDNECVQIVGEELSCIDFDNIVACFDFVIASRYHSVVHSYKKAVPAIVLGWAVKYRELAKCFGQADFCFDVRGQIELERIFSSIDYMESEAITESAKIASVLKTIQQENVYDNIMY